MPNSSHSVTGHQNGVAQGDHVSQPVEGGVEAQLRDLYAQRLELQNALGTADSQAIIAMVKSLETQLADLYNLFRGRDDHLPEPKLDDV